MASIKPVLYTSKTLKDSTHPIMIQIIHKRKIRKISIGHNLLKEQWDFENNKPNENARNQNKLSSLINKKVSDAEVALIRIENEKGNNFEIDELIDIITNRKEKLSFSTYTNELIDIMNKTNRIGNANSYKNALNVFKNFLKVKEVLFSDVNYSNLIKFRDHHLAEGHSINGHNVYTRAIRAIYNKAIKENKVNPTNHPFEKYSIKNTKTAKRALSKEDLLKIINLPLDSSNELWNTRNLFLFSFHMIGINWVDMAHLKLSNIIDNRIKYYRKKTHKPYSIAINNDIQEILNQYTTDKGNNDYIFPIIEREENEDAHKDIRNKLKIYNADLKLLGKEAKISTELTSYVARHTWASIAYFSNVHIGIIQQGMGHDDVKTTQTYLAEFNNSEIDNANSNLLK